MAGGEEGDAGRLPTGAGRNLAAEEQDSYEASRRRVVQATWPQLKHEPTTNHEAPPKGYAGDQRRTNCVSVD